MNNRIAVIVPVYKAERYIAKIFMPIDNWISLIITMGSVAIVATLLNLAIIFNKSERIYLKNIILSKIKRTRR